MESRDWNPKNAVILSPSMRRESLPLTWFRLAGADSPCILPLEVTQKKTSSWRSSPSINKKSSTPGRSTGRLQAFCGYPEPLKAAPYWLEMHDFVNIEPIGSLSKSTRLQVVLHHTALCLLTNDSQQASSNAILSSSTDFPIPPMSLGKHLGP